METVAIPSVYGVGDPQSCSVLMDQVGKEQASLVFSVAGLARAAANTSWAI